MLRTLAELYILASFFMSVWFCAVAFATLTIRPYKQTSHNVAAGLAYFYFLIPIALSLYAKLSLIIDSRTPFAIAIVLVYILFLLPSVLGICVFASHLIKLRRLRRSSRQHSSARNPSVASCTDLHIDNSSEGTTPDRVLRPEEYGSGQLSTIVVQ